MDMTENTKPSNAIGSFVEWTFSHLQCDLSIFFFSHHRFFRFRRSAKELRNHV